MKRRSWRVCQERIVFVRLEAVSRIASRLSPLSAPTDAHLLGLHGGVALLPLCRQVLRRHRVEAFVPEG